MAIHKDCFYADNLFINKLEIIAKSQKNNEEQDEDGWIQAKSHIKENNNRPTRNNRNE